MAHRDEQAIVMGGSIAGLLSARVLASRFERVIVVERDILPLGATHRRGVPQGRHPHVLHPAGCVVFEELFPGFLSDLARCGAVLGDSLDEIGRFVGNGYFRRRASGLTSAFMSRKLFEATVRARVRALPNVVFREGWAVRGLVPGNDGRSIAGVRLERARDSDGEELLTGDLTVDATGRGSRLPTWLAELGFETPVVEDVKIGMASVSGVYRRSASHAGGLKAVAVAPTRQVRRGGAMLAQEGGNWIVTVAGYLGDRPSTDPAAFVEFARSLAAPILYDVVRSGDPIGELRPYSFPSNQRRRYEWLRHPPRRLLVLGDAICSFNPFSGQGMSVCALEAKALDEWLQNDREALPSRYFERCARLIDGAWYAIVADDRRLVGSGRARSPRQWLLDWYLDRVEQAAHHDGDVALALLRVMNFLDRPARLLRPRLALRVAGAVLRAPIGPPQSSSPTARAHPEA